MLGGTVKMLLMPLDRQHQAPALAIMDMQKCRAMIGCVPVMMPTHLTAQMPTVQVLLQEAVLVIRLQGGEHYHITCILATTGVTVSADIMVTLVVNKATEMVIIAAILVVGTDVASSG